MSEPAGKSTTAIGLAILVAFVALFALFAHWLRLSSSPVIDAEGPGMPTQLKPPFAPPNPNMPAVSKAEADRIAVNEVKKREGWVGKAMPAADREGFRWYITVRHDPTVPHDYRSVTIDGRDGEVLDYTAFKTEQP